MSAGEVRASGFMAKMRDHQPKIMDGLMIAGGIVACVFLAMLASNQRVFHKVLGEHKFGHDLNYHTYTTLGGMAIFGSVASVVLVAKGVVGLTVKCVREQNETLPDGEACRNLEDNSKKWNTIAGMSALLLLAICIFTAIKSGNEIVAARDGSYTYTTYSGAGMGCLVTSILTGMAAIAAAVWFVLREEGLQGKTITATQIGRIKAKCPLKELAEIILWENCWNNNFGPHGLRAGELSEQDVRFIRSTVERYQKLQAQLEAAKEVPLKVGDEESRPLIAINRKIREQNRKNVEVRDTATRELADLQTAWDRHVFDVVRVENQGL